MPKVHKTVVTLRFGGDDLCHQEVTRRLGGIPTLTQKMGEEIHHKSGTRLAKTGQWQLTVEGATPEDLETLLGRLFGQLSSDYGVWRNLSERFAGNLYIGLFMQESNEGMQINRALVRAVAERGLALGFDVYCPTDE